MQNGLLTALSEGKVSVTFTKLNGEERVMVCTKQFDLIPEEHRAKSDKPHKQSDEVIPVFDLDKQAWRSFRNDSVKEWKCL